MIIFLNKAVSANHLDSIQFIIGKSFTLKVEQNSLYVSGPRPKAIAKFVLSALNELDYEIDYVEEAA